jgi:hypothetical protein
MTTKVPVRRQMVKYLPTLASHRGDVLSPLPAFKSHTSLVLLSCLVVVVANLQSLQLPTGPPVAVLETI